MSDSRFVQPWHGMPRERIAWSPAIESELCNGCGLCVISCGRAVFRYDYERHVAVVTEPQQCMVGCVTCANTCPSVAISFPPQSTLKLLIRRERILQRVEKVELEDRTRYALVPLEATDGVATTPAGSASTR